MAVKPRVSASVAVPIKKAVADLAAQKGVSESEMVERLVEAGLKAEGVKV
jgi:hypothetical protein